MSEFKLILADIDGTILPAGHHQVSERTTAALEAALDAGIRVGVATGRAREWAIPMLRNKQRLADTMLATNGMQVFLDGELLHEEQISNKQIGRMAEFLEQLPHAGLVCFDGGVPQLVAGSIKDMELCFPKYVESCRILHELPSTPTVKCNAFQVGDLDNTRAFSTLLNEQFDDLSFDVPQPAWINVTPRGWSKATGIDLLCQAIGCSLDAVAVFGDGGNDVTMLEHVPYSVAVQGAAPEALAAARYHIGRCEDDAVAATIEAIVAGRWEAQD